MERKLLALDLDGTAVCDDYSLGKLSREAIELAEKEGHVVAFVSGRRDIDMLTMGNDRWCADYLILNNGGKIIRCRDRAVLRNDLIDAEACRKLIEYSLSKNLQLQVCSALIWQVTVMTEGTMEYAARVGVIPEVVGSLDEIDWKNGLEGFMATRDMIPIAKYIDENLKSEMCYIDSEPGCIDIMAYGVTKWGGVKHLAEILGIDQKDIIAAGNYYNDIDMLQNAGVGIAVANSLEEVKKVADYVTKADNNHDAVAEIINLMLEGYFDK